MKKLYTLLFIAAATVSANAQYLSKDFDDSDPLSGGWTVQEPTPATTTSLTWTTSTAGGATSPYGMIKNYNGTDNEPLESWLISPSTDLSGSTTPTLSFINAYNYTGDALELKISTDYDGSSDPTAQGNWTSLTGSATWSSGGFAWSNSGNIDLSSYMVSGVYIAFVYTGSGTDGSTWEIDDILINETGAAIPTAVSVYDIQYTLAGNGNSPYMDSTITTGGIVSAVRTDGNYYIQSGTGEASGVYVYDQNSVAIGDSVTFQAAVTEFNGLTELTNISNFVKVTVSNPVPQTITTTANGNTELYEGVLITIQNANCTVATDGFGDWTIDDGSGVTVVGDFMYAYTAIVGGPYEVTGIVDYAFGNFRLQPRFAADIVTTVGISENTLLDTKVYPNPASSIVSVEAPVNSAVNIYSIDGKVCISTTTSSNIEMINTSSLESGNYIISIVNDNAIATQKLIIE